jgi:hypothetical protein
MKFMPLRATVGPSSIDFCKTLVIPTPGFLTGKMSSLENPNLINPTLNNGGPFRWWLRDVLRQQTLGFGRSRIGHA